MIRIEAKQTHLGRPFMADATTSDPRPEGLGYSVRPFHGRYGLETRGIFKLQPGLKLWAESCFPYRADLTFSNRICRFLFVIGHLSFVILPHESSPSLLG